MRFPISIVIACAIVGTGAFFTGTVRAQDADNAYVALAAQDLQSLVAPVALYPDAMLAQILVACSYPSDVAAAVQYLDGGGDPNAIDSQGWDLSVAGVARYPDFLHYMASNGDWMNSLGAAFVNQQADVMTAVQVLRSQAMAAGNLVSNEQQQVVVDDDGTIEIIPTDPQNIYPPIYDPALVYVAPVVVPGVAYVPLIRFWHGIPCGAWLHHDLDWHDHRLYVGAWGVNRPWWGHAVGGGRFDYTHDRPGLYASNVIINQTVHGRVVNVQGGAWSRQMHDPQKPMPRAVIHSTVHPSGHPGTGYAPRETVQHQSGIANYNHAPVVSQQSTRGRESLSHAAPPAVHPVQQRSEPVRRAVPSQVHSNPAPVHQAPAQPVHQAPAQPARQAPVQHSAPAHSSAVGSYGNGAAASSASNRGAASRGHR